MVCCDIGHRVVSAMFAGMNENVWRDDASSTMKCDTASAVIITHSDCSVVFSSMGDLTPLLDMLELETHRGLDRCRSCLASQYFHLYCKNDIIPE